jgi:tRNA A37 N6-isopentenylltransferase MiaA
MQLYEGLPIITNKIKEDEKKGVPDHLLGCIGLHEETWTVSTFVDKASRVVRSSIQHYISRIFGLILFRSRIFTIEGNSQFS